MRIAVGFDGSEVARAAVDHALDRAGPDGTVYVVHAFGPPPDWLGHPGYQRILDEHESRGREILDGLRSEIGAAPGPQLIFELIAGPAAEAIANVARTRDADEIVVGSRGFGRVRAALGSVSHRLLHETDRPVLVIPEIRGD